MGQPIQPPSTEQPAQAKARRACHSALAVVLFLVVTLAGIGLDLGSKKYVFDLLLNDPATVAKAHRLQFELPADPNARDVLRYLSPHRDVMPGLRFTLSTNPGVVFGLDMPPWAVVVATLAAIILVASMFAASPTRAWSIHMALAFILAGAVGNLYDRAFGAVRLPLGNIEITHQVRDFIDLSQLHYIWVFNVADILLVLGVGILMINWVWGPKRPKAESTKLETRNPKQAPNPND